MRRLQLKTNVLAPTTDYPYGRLKDNTGIANGTPVNELSYGDMHQFFERLMVLSGITPNDLPENNANGWQLADALQSLIAKGAPGDTNGAWVDGGTTLTFNSDQTFTVEVADIKINKYKIFGKTIFWHLSVANATTSGTPTYLEVQLPSALVSAGYSFMPGDITTQGVYNNTTTSYVSTGADLIGVQKTAVIKLATSFPNGTNNQSFQFLLIRELL